MGALDQDDTKIALRRAMIERRARLTSGEVVMRSAAVCARVLALPEFATAERVVTYGPIGREVDPSAVVAAAVTRGTPVYRPVRARIAFVGDDVLTPEHGGRGILFLVPGVAFDERGVRLGRGDGWYDRALAPFPAAWRLGLAFEFQMLPVVPASASDVPMHRVVTEERVLGIGPGEPGTLRGNHT
jgi:5-formyltetrahydrofolate cyclo-ligase